MDKLIKYASTDATPTITPKQKTKNQKSLVVVTQYIGNQRENNNGNNSHSVNKKGNIRKLK